MLSVWAFRPRAFASGGRQPRRKPGEMDMMAKKGHIRCLGAMVLLAVITVAEAQNSTSSQKSQTPYQRLLRIRRQQADEKTPEAASTGPVVAVAKMRSVHAMGVAPVGYLAMQRQGTTLVRPPELHRRVYPPMLPKSRCTSSLTWATGRFTG